MLLVETYVGPSEIEGVGVFAAQPIPRGTTIWTFDPGLDQLVAEDEIAKMPESVRNFMARYSYRALADPSKFILESDNGRFMNHRLPPNTRFTDPDFGFAIADIAADEEIVCNYAEFEPDFVMLSGRRFTQAPNGKAHPEVGLMSGPAWAASRAGVGAL
jgi:uncharacterized protein